MLNELCQLADVLETVNIKPKEWHPQLKPLPKASFKKQCYKISIADDGTITSIDTLNEELVDVLRKWEPSSLGNSFPGFNIQPLYRITGEEEKKQFKSWRDGKEKTDVGQLKEWCGKRCSNWDRKIEMKISKCLGEIPKDLAMRLASDGSSISISVQKLFTRILQFLHKDEERKGKKDVLAKRFLKVLEDYLWKAIEDEERTKILLPILIHEGDAKKKSDDDRGSVSVFLDIPDWQEFPVAHLKSIEWINDMMIKQPAQSTYLSNDLDAYGLPSSGQADKLPGVRLPIVADVKLRAMTSESPCQFRYGKIDAISFPVGGESRKKAKGALEWLVAKSREGETWGRADAKELIFAYPVQLPNVPLKLAACFGAQKSDDTEARFSNAAKDVIDGLKAAANDLRNIEIRVFSLKKMDKARTKVVFHRNYTAQRLLDASQEWEAGCANIPDISIRVWGEQKGQWEFTELRTPFPLQVPKCLNRIWKQDGTTECEAPLVAPSEGINLLLDEQPERFAPHLLAVFLQNAKGLLLSLGDVLSLGEIISVKGYDNQKLLMPAILGLLLYKLDIRKESYMNNPPFLVGRMLKLADDLHALYCKEVRDNNLPPQLIGNSMMTAALESPVQALAQLALRLKPYYGWAQTFKGNESERLSGYFVGLYGEVAAELAKQKLPSRLNDTERAELLLGYLAANPKKNANQTSSTEKTN